MRDIALRAGPLDDRNGDAPPGSHVVAIGLQRAPQQRAVAAALDELSGVCDGCRRGGNSEPRAKRT